MNCLRIAALAGLVVIAGCASNTGIVPIGKGLYMASSMDYMSWSAGGVKAELYKNAGTFCAKQGKEVVPVSDKTEDATLAGRYASAEIQFRCE